MWKTGPSIQIDAFACMLYPIKHQFTWWVQQQASPNGCFLLWTKSRKNFVISWIFDAKRKVNSQFSTRKSHAFKKSFELQIHVQLLNCGHLTDFSERGILNSFFFLHQNSWSHKIQQMNLFQKYFCAVLPTVLIMQGVPIKNCQK